jgi:hypothetical protein
MMQRQASRTMGIFAERWAARWVRPGFGMRAARVAATTVVLSIPIVTFNTGGDWWAYYNADLQHLYEGSALGTVTFVYPPPFAQFLVLLNSLPAPVFFALFAGAEALALIYLVGPFWAALLVLSGIPNVYEEIQNANVDLIIAAAIVIGFRHPSLWAFPSLLKVTPIVGALWFAGRGEWRRFWIAVITTIAIVVVSFALSPGAWKGWFNFIVEQAGNASYVNPVSFAVRFPLAVGLVLFAARSDRPWLVPIGVAIGLPAPASIQWTITIAAVPLWLARRQAERQSLIASGPQRPAT